MAADHLAGQKSIKRVLFLGREDYPQRALAARQMSGCGTLVTFELKDADGGTLLTVVESGFDRLSPARLADIYRKNDEGWTAQMDFVRNYVERTA